MAKHQTDGQPGTYGDYVTLIAAANVYNRVINLIVKYADNTVDLHEFTPDQNVLPRDKDIWLALDVHVDDNSSHYTALTTTEDKGRYKPHNIYKWK